MEKANKEIILNYHDLVFNQHCPEEAVFKYFSENYVHHGQSLDSGKEYFIKSFTSFFKEFSDFKVKILRFAVSGNLVFLHVHAKKNESDLGDMVVDIYRLKNGKICEHWDVIQKIERNQNLPNAYP